MFKKPYSFGVFYAILLILFSGWVMLDTFVIPHAYVLVEQESTSTGVLDTNVDDSNVLETSVQSSSANTSDTEDTETVTAEAVVTENTYDDGNISITITEIRAYNTTIYVADIQVTSTDYLSTAFAANTYGRNITEKTSEIADEVDAILAINGDYYGAQKQGYVIRNGVLYRSSSAGSDQEDLVIYADGSFEVINEGDITAEALLENGAVQVLSFGPGLIEDGEIAVTQNEEVDKAMTSNPRTAIGIIDSLHYVMVVSDGRTSESEGLTLYQLAQVMEDLGVTTAYNLDGGGSATMVFDGEVVNNPTTDGRKITERSVSDIVYIGYTN